MKKFSKGMRKYIRKQKPEIRKIHSNPDEQEKAIRKLLESLENN